MSRTAKLLIYLTLSLFVVSGVKAHDLDESTGVICDTQAQIERYARLGLTPQAIAIINEGTHACALVNVRYIRGGEVNRIHSDKSYQVVEILIVQANMHGQWGEIKPTIQYALFPIKEEEA